jgi:hypothetical protein
MYNPATSRVFYYEYTDITYGFSRCYFTVIYYYIPSGYQKIIAMKNITKFSIAALVFATFASHAQTKPARQFGQAASRCGSTEYENLLLQKDPTRKDIQQFEQWLSPKVAHAKRKRLQKDGNDTNEVLTIPVVVHIIHDGDAIGQSENIADGQILSQITVLNQDFRKMEGTPGFNTNPVGADTGIEFCLAKRDPQGFYTNGIKRYKRNVSALTFSQMEELKTQTQWDPERYLNLWVVQSVSMDGGQLLGYAQFPVNSGIDGLDNLGTPITANTDGVVLAYGAFGSEDIYPAGNYFPGSDKGQIAAHEVGHFLGLRHIWGDMPNCNGTDFCDDTPVAAGPNSDCPPPGWDTCLQNPGFDMIQNYMDYTNDVCRNVFTLDQKDRMLAVLANSPRRASLLTSNACQPGITLSNDGSFNILNVNTQCSTSFTPQILLENYGNNAITSATITYAFDEGTSQVFNWTGNLAIGGNLTISLPETSTDIGHHVLNANLTTVNGTTDPNLLNNVDTRPFSIAGSYNTQQIILTIQPDNFSDETYWELKAGDGSIVASVVTISFQNPETTITVNNGECYSFTMYDWMGDGMCCTNGEGFYTLKTSGGILIAEGGEFTDKDETKFRIDTTLGNAVFNSSGNVKLYPNPANDILNIAVTNTNPPESYVVYNSLGQVMDNGNITSAPEAIDISAYAKGVYFVRLATGSELTTLQFVKH